MAIGIVAKNKTRPLPLFLLIDTSGSMHGEKIDCVNAALREMIKIFSEIQNPKGEIKLNIISFGKTVEVLHKMESPKKITLEELTAYGPTPMGDAIFKAIEMIQDKSIVPENSLLPTIVLISDGLPTDCNIDFLRNNEFSNWEPMKKLMTAERVKNCQRLALAIGENANIGMLKGFIGNSEIPVIKADNVPAITKFFQWVTMSVSLRSTSREPNKFVVSPVKEFFGDQELVF